MRILKHTLCTRITNLQDNNYIKKRIKLDFGIHLLNIIIIIYVQLFLLIPT